MSTEDKPIYEAERFGRNKEWSGKYQVHHYDIKIPGRRNEKNVKTVSEYVLDHYSCHGDSLAFKQGVRIHTIEIEFDLRIDRGDYDLADHVSESFETSPCRKTSGNKILPTGLDYANWPWLYEAMKLGIHERCLQCPFNAGELIKTRFRLKRGEPMSDLIDFIHGEHSFDISFECTLGKFEDPMQKCPAIMSDKYNNLWKDRFPYGKGFGKFVFTEEQEEWLQSISVKIYDEPTW